MDFQDFYDQSAPAHSIMKEKAMDEVVTDVHGISAAVGWFVTEKGLSRPVACFALVSVASPDFPYVEKQVIPLTEDDLGLSLIGFKIDTTRIVQHQRDVGDNC